MTLFTLVVSCYQASNFNDINLPIIIQLNRNSTALVTLATHTYTKYWGSIELINFQIVKTKNSHQWEIIDKRVFISRESFAPQVLVSLPSACLTKRVHAGVRSTSYIRLPHKWIIEYNFQCLPFASHLWDPARSSAARPKSNSLLFFCSNWYS